MKKKLESFRNGRLVNFKRVEVVYGSNMGFEIQVGKNNQVVEVRTAPITVSKKGKRFFVGTLTVVPEMMWSIQNRPMTTAIIDHIMNWDKPVDNESI